MIDTDKTVSTDLSLFFYGLRNISEEATGLSLFGYFIYDDKAQLVYDYGEYTNKLNPIWNNSYSMLRGQVSLNTPALSSAMANYYQTNVATQYTNAVNIKAQQANDWQNVAFNRADDAFNVLRTATKTISPNPFDWVKAGANTKIDIANTITNAMRDDINTRYQHEMQNRNYQANINNIKSSPSTALTTPSLLACIPQTAG
jgi:hypothetical protein